MSASSKPASIQAEARKHGKSIGAYLNDKSKKGAFNAGLPWSSDDVSILASMVLADDTTFDMATRLGRTFYGASAARQHIGFAMRHWDTLEGVMTE